LRAVRVTVVVRCWRWFIAMLVIVLAVGRVSPSTHDATATPSPTRKATTTPTPSCLDLSARPPVPVVDRSWTVDALLARHQAEGSSVWADGDELTFFYQGEAEAVHVCCGIQLPLRRVEDSDLWALTVRIDELPRAVISYTFIPYQDGRPVEAEARLAHMRVWRGSQAPPASERAESLHGQIIKHAIDSVYLDERRDLTVYVPPGHDPTQSHPVVYAADGQSVDRFAAILDPQIVNGSVPGVIVVGVHCPASGGAAEPYDPALDRRAQEYLLGENPDRFEAHERFFVDEVSAWAERALGASAERQERAVFGCSNGGAFAVSMGIRHPARYGAVIAFSLGEGPQGWGTPEWRADDAPRHYLVAGTLEPFRGTTARWAARLSRLGVEHVHRERVCGHDPVMWEEEFPGAVAWAIGRDA
jgi:enterochelin esterase-like enzyme